MKKWAEKPTSTRFTSEDKKIIEKLSARLGISHSAVLKLAIRRMAKFEKGN